MHQVALVTGGAGFIGSHLTRRLLREGYRVRVFDNLANGKKENLADILGEIEFIQGDIHNPEEIQAAVQGVACIWHQAALPSVPLSIKDPVNTHQANVNGTFNVLLAARACSVPRVVLASSSSVYGDTPTLPKHEGMPPCPLSPYATHKLTNELYARQFFLHFGVETVCLRYFNVFGPRQDPASAYAAVIPCFVRRIRQGLAPVLFGDGLQTRDFTYVENVVEANLLAARAPGVGGEVFNVASGGFVTVLNLATKIAEWMNWTQGVEYAPPRQGDILHSFADISKAHAMMGYTPLVSFEEGLVRTLEWFAPK